jgi:propanediol utilization protein
MDKILTEVSARHVHLSKQDGEKLFGSGKELKKIKDLSQPGEFSAEQKVDLKTSKNILKEVRIIGPWREQTQVEISQTDAYFLGLNPPIRESGDLADSEKCVLIGPQGEVNLSAGVIVAQRHLHLDLFTAKKNNLKNKDLVSVKIDSEKRSLVFHQVVVRVDSNFEPAFHIDTDEGNAAGIKKTALGEIIK